MTDSHIDLGARVAALELLVEQLIFERVMMTEQPSAAVRAAMGRLTGMATERPDVPQQAIGAIADVLAQVMTRLVDGDRGGELPPLRWGGE